MFRALTVTSVVIGTAVTRSEFPSLDTPVLSFFDTTKVKNIDPRKTGALFNYSSGESQLLAHIFRRAISHVCGTCSSRRLVERKARRLVGLDQGIGRAADRGGDAIQWPQVRLQVVALPARTAGAGSHGSVQCVEHPPRPPPTSHLPPPTSHLPLIHIPGPAESFRTSRYMNSSPS